jgi:hypothetical protein
MVAQEQKANERFLVKRVNSHLEDETGREFIPTNDSRIHTDPYQWDCYVSEERQGSLFLQKVIDGNDGFFSRRTNTSNDKHVMDYIISGVSYELRDDVLFGLDQTKFSSVRANKPGRFSINEKPTEQDIANEMTTCIGEQQNHSKTPQPRRYYDELEFDGYTPLTVPNKFPFSQMHTINLFARHDKRLLERIVARDLMNYLLIGRENAKAIRKAGFEGMISFINFGKLAGASIPHPHSQDQAESSYERSVSKAEVKIYE